MIMGTVIQGRSYGKLEYVSAGVLVLGITLFTLGDAAASPEFSPVGIFLITLGVVADAITSNFEEASFFRKSLRSPNSSSRRRCQPGYGFDFP